MLRTHGKESAIMSAKISKNLNLRKNKNQKLMIYLKQGPCLMIKCITSLNPQRANKRCVRTTMTNIRLCHIARVHMPFLTILKAMILIQLGLRHQHLQGKDTAFVNGVIQMQDITPMLIRMLTNI